MNCPYVSLFHQLQHQPGHAVDPGVAAGDQRHILAARSQLQRLPAALHLPHHAGGDDFLPHQQRLDELQVGLVADHHARHLDGLVGLEGHMIQIARTDADDEQFTHGYLNQLTGICCCSAIARVTLPLFTFFSSSVPPADASRAAGSATPAAPMAARACSDGGDGTATPFSSSLA